MQLSLQGIFKQWATFGPINCIANHATFFAAGVKADFHADHADLQFHS